MRRYWALAFFSVILALSDAALADGTATITYPDGTSVRIVTNPSGSIVFTFDKKGNQIKKENFPEAGGLAGHQALISKLSKPDSKVEDHLH